MEALSSRFAPTIKVSVAILPRAAQVLVNLREAVGHRSLPAAPLRSHPWT